MVEPYLIKKNNGYFVKINRICMLSQVHCCRSAVSGRFFNPDTHYLPSRFFIQSTIQLKLHSEASLEDYCLTAIGQASVAVRPSCYTVQ